jgi:CRISPR/Cas system CSM-associated protein Csm2 small subunit
LVSNANDLADTFYRGDIETAFNQALELGYDKQELVGYALQLNRIEQTQVVKAYDYVQHFNDQSGGESEKEKSTKPVAQYLDKMLSVLDQAQQRLQGPDDYNTMINGIINEMKDVQVPDLVQAINRFHTFNQQLLEALPKSDTPVTSE